MKVISGSSNLPLAKSISKDLSVDLINIEITKFANNEKRILIKDDVHGHNVTLLQSFSDPVDEHIIESLLIIDALERMGAKHINFVIPWLGYSLQDKVFQNGESIAANVIAGLISNSYVKRTFLLDVHNASIAGFFSIPTHHLSALELFVEYVKKNFDLESTIIASPDFGGLKRAAVFAKQLNLELVNIDKNRNPKTGSIDQMTLHGDVQDKQVLVFDDVIVSGGTVVKTAEVLKESGAKEVHFLVTHGLLVDKAITKLESSAIDSIVITNSIKHQHLPNKVKVIDCAKLFSAQLKSWM